MAIQGIINGFANSANLAQNVVLVGRVVSYILLVNGAPEGEPTADLEQALERFDAAAARHCQGDWLRVTDLVSNNVNNVSTVTQTRNERYDDYVAARVVD